MMNAALLEVCVDSVESAIAAERGGAERVELCSNLLEGGVTPSFGLISTARSRISIGLHVMIRPRPGDFCYSSDEFDTMRCDILAAKQLGANSVVLGILKPTGNIDIGRTRELVELARPLSVTFHRAFDMSSDLLQALEDVAQTGADRILTSGGEPSALEGIGNLRRLVNASAGRVFLMACGGIRDHNVRTIVEQTGVKEIHAGMTELISSPMLSQNRRVALGTVEGREYERRVVTQGGVEKMHRALREVELAGGPS